jgi:predicted secreted hydrolase
VSAFFEEQEVATGLGKTYWEGLVGVVDDRGSRGLGYVELTE